MFVFVTASKVISPTKGTIYILMAIGKSVWGIVDTAEIYFLPQFRSTLLKIQRYVMTQLGINKAFISIK
jgi:hypothetical protein